MPAELTELESAVETATKLSEENTQLRDELGRYKEQALISPEEQAQRWGRSVLDVIDKSA